MQTLTQMSQYFSRQGKGQRKKEVQAGCGAHSPVLRTLAAVHMCRTGWRVGRTLFLGHLHTWQPQYPWPSWGCWKGRHGVIFLSFTTTPV